MRENEPITHFVSLEIESEKIVKRISKLQDDLSFIEGIGERIKLTSLHVPMAVLSVKDHEVEHAINKIQRATNRFKDMLTGDMGFMLSCSGIGFGDYGACWIDIQRID